MRPALIRQHLDAAPAGRLVGWLDARGLPYVIHRSWSAGAPPDPAEYAFVASLGHSLGAGDTHDPAVAGEHALLARAVELGVPVLGLCYGAQVLAAVLGARVGAAPVPELGWVEVDTDDPDRVPSGPWLAWHFDRFDIPPGAREVARTAAAPQAFRSGPHLGVQFHPEATPQIVAAWARAHAARLTELGVAEAGRRLTGTGERVRAAERAAFRLFDAFLAGTDQI